jgi:hypothetical protein
MNDQRKPQPACLRYRGGDFLRWRESNEDTREGIASRLQELLQRKIVDRAGKTGEHYVAWTRKEYWHIWAAAAGGGLLTTVTAAVKIVIVGAGLALFVEGLAFCSLSTPPRAPTTCRAASCSTSDACWDDASCAPPATSCCRPAGLPPCASIDLLRAFATV